MVSLVLIKYGKMIMNILAIKPNVIMQHNSLFLIQFPQRQLETHNPKMLESNFIAISSSSCLFDGIPADIHVVVILLGR